MVDVPRQATQHPQGRQAGCNLADGRVGGPRDLLGLLGINHNDLVKLAKVGAVLSVTTMSAVQSLLKALHVGTHSYPNRRYRHSICWCDRILRDQGN